MNLIQLHKRLLAVTAATALLAACNLTEDDKKRIDDAEDKIEKIALDPKILQPSDQETVSGVVTVLVDVDDSVEYNKVTLQVGADVVEEDLEAPYAFDIDTYFLASEEKVTLLAKAYMADGNQLRSEVVNIIIDPTAGSSLRILSPSANEAFDQSSTISISWTEIPTAASYEYQLNGGEVFSTTTTTADISLEDVSMHSLRVRAKNEKGEAGVWSQDVSFSTGLFAYAFELKQYGGWSSYDRNDSPIDMLISESDFVVLAQGSDQYTDGSGDSYNASVAAISTNGTFDWHQAYANYQNPQSISKTNSGFLVATKGQGWRDAAVFEVDNNGIVQWSHEKPGIEPNGASTYTNEEINAAVELDSNTILLSRTLRNYEQYKDSPSDTYWQSRLNELQLSFELIDKSTNAVTETVVAQPLDGEYTSVDQFLITENDIKAVGSFHSDTASNDGSHDSYTPIQTNGSGSVVFTLNNTGVLDSTKTVTGGGPKYTNIKDLATLSSGELLVGFSGWDRSGVTKFNSDLSDSTYVNAQGVQNTRMAAHPTLDEYVIAGEAESQYGYTQLLRFQDSTLKSRVQLDKYSSNLSIKAIQYDERFGYVILATDEGSMNNNNGSYSVLFNISDTNEYLVPTQLEN